MSRTCCSVRCGGCTGLGAMKVAFGAALSRQAGTSSPQPTPLRHLPLPHRDFNLPKILVQDLDVFCGLLADIFPGVGPLRQVQRAAPA